MDNFSGIPQLITASPPRDQQFRSGTIAVRSNALVIGNSVYQLCNISSFRTLNISKTKSIPAVFWILLLLGIGFLFPSGEIKILGLILLIGALGLFFDYWRTRKVDRFVLAVSMNSGESLSVISSNMEFLKQMAVALFKIIDQKEIKSLTFNLDNRTILDNISGAVINMGAVDGDIVNNV